MPLKHVVIRALISWAFRGESHARLASGWVSSLSDPFPARLFQQIAPEGVRAYSAHFLAQFGAIRFSAAKLNSGELHEKQHDTDLAYRQFPLGDFLSHHRSRPSPVISGRRHRHDLQRK